jgi:hypothetical protein
MPIVPSPADHTGKGGRRSRADLAPVQEKHAQQAVANIRSPAVLKILE